MASEMIERLAERFKTLPVRDSTDPELDMLRRREAARAVIEAMREPTESMIEEAWAEATAENAVGVWRDMIDEALK